MNLGGAHPFPDFLGIGFQKCGTTTLFDLLAEHPEVALAREVKEPMYYRVPLAYYLSWPWRRRFYPWRYFGHLGAEETRQVGEINAGLSFGGCARRLTADLSHDTKLIFMLRNPVERAYSAFKFFCALGFLPRSVIRDDLKHGHAAAFGRYCEGVLGNPAQRGKISQKRMKYLCFSQGNYADLMGEFSAFPRQYCILFEEFVRAQRETCRGLYDFLGISDPDTGIPYGKKANETNRRAVSPGRAHYRKVVKGFNYAFDEFVCLSHWCPPLFRTHKRHTRRAFYRCTAPDEDQSKMSAQTRALLEDYYRPQKDAVARLLGRSLDDVWFR